MLDDYRDGFGSTWPLEDDWASHWRSDTSPPWRYQFSLASAVRYEIVARWYPDLSERARPISQRDEAFKALDVLGWTKGG